MLDILHPLDSFILTVRKEVSLTWTLARSSRFEPPPGPVVVVVMDGIGLATPDEGNAVHLAHTPTLDLLFNTFPHIRLNAHGTAVGLPSDKDMGNSEVGHNALGAGRVFDQGAKLVNEAIQNRSIFTGEVWTEIMNRCSGGGALHLIVEYLDSLEGLLLSIHSPPDRVYRIASGGGRMRVTMDRYMADWEVVERGFNAHVHGEGRAFPSARAAIETYRKEDPEVIDQFLPSFVVADGDGPVGRIVDGDSVVFFNFRGDRAIEISMAFDNDNFTYFDRGKRPDVYYAGMMLYDGDLQIPRHFLVPPPSISRTMGEYLARNGMKQLASAETQKYGHVTYFWNGNRSGKFSEELETYIEIPSDRVPFEQRPWMKAAEVTDAFVEALRTERPHFARINYANGDMVGHTGVLSAARIAVEAVDLSLNRLLRAVKDLNGLALVTADHGNADEMFEKNSKTGEFRLDDQGRRRPKTSHTLSPVPLILYQPEGHAGAGLNFNNTVREPGLANVAATAFSLMGLEPPEDYEPSLI
jgi:2,3-bisphosphoglycerate-independent phosphoglycerate mutase